MFWLCGGHSIDNTGMFLLFLSRACTQPSPFLLIPSEGTAGAQELGRGHSWDSWLQVTKQIFYTIWQHDQYIKSCQKGGRGEGLQCYHCELCLSSPVALRMAESCFPMDGWTPACHRKWWANSLAFCFPCTCSFCLSYWPVFISTTSFLTFTLMIVSSMVPGRWNKHLHGAQLVAGLEIQHMSSCEKSCSAPQNVKW